MRTNDVTVDCAAWATYYYVVDANSGRVWSRNRWGTSKSVPDLWATKAAANRSLGNTKLSQARQYGGNPTVKEVLLGFDTTRIINTP